MKNYRKFLFFVDIQFYKTYNNTTNEIISINQNDIDVVEVSDFNLISILNNKLIASEEGEIKVKYKYTYNNMDFEYEGTYYIYDKGFNNGDYPVINKSYMDLKVDENTGIAKCALKQTGTYAVNIPLPYNEDTYYQYNWEIDDNSVAQIEKISNENDWKSCVKVTPLKAGNTNIICTVSTAEGESIKKMIRLTVTEDTPTEPIDQEDEPTQEPTNIEDNTVAEDILPKAGKRSIIIGLILICLIVSIISYKKRNIF